MFLKFDFHWKFFKMFYLLEDLIEVMHECMLFLKTSRCAELPT